MLYNNKALFALLQKEKEMPKVPNACLWQRKHLRQAMKGWLRSIFWVGHINPMPIFIDPLNTYVNTAVEIGQETVIEPNVWIMGKTKIGKNCRIKFGSVIVDSILEDNVLVDGGRIEKSVIGHHAEIGYTAQLKRVRRFGAHSKMLHHGYLGDAVVGDRVNIGAGVITANYDGANKNQTIIEDDAFIGTNVCLVAPIKILKGMMIAAGSTVTAKDPMEPWKLLIARSSAHLSRSKRVVKNEEGWRLAEFNPDAEVYKQ